MTQRVLFDTNIFIDALADRPEAVQELAHWSDPAISFVTWIELHAGAKPGDAEKIAELMDGLEIAIIYPDAPIMEAAAAMMTKRRADGVKKIALPDMIIAATGKIHERVVVTRNTSDFKENVRVPYELVQVIVPPIYEVKNHLPPAASALDKRRQS